MRRYPPPAIACRLFELLVPAWNREAMLGDLVEEYVLRAQSTSAFAAARWFWSQACRSAACRLWFSLRIGDCLINMCIAMGVYFAVEILELATNLVISRLVAPSEIMHVALAPVVFLTAAAVGGCVAARIRRGATIFLALLVMISVVVSIDLKICATPVPWWYSFGFLVLGPLAVLIAPAAFGALAPGVKHAAK